MAGATPPAAGASSTQPGGEGQSFLVQPPAISLPKGGGAIRGLGETFAANPVTGTGSMSVPIATSQGRGGFGPQLSLSYDSGSGNGLFGMGWSLALPAISRKTDKGLPRYRDWSEDPLEADGFLLAGAEDLVPEFRKDETGDWLAAQPAGHGLHRDPAEHWILAANNRPVLHEERIDGYRVRRYRPRVEGLFARIEHWQWIPTATDPRPEDEQRADAHWRTISRDNLLTLYGIDAQSRIADPADPARIFSWLICESRDDKGNGIRYLYKAEDGRTTLGPGQEDPFQAAHQRNRGGRADHGRTAQRYPHRILYGNRRPLLTADGERPRHLSARPEPPGDTAADWLFEVRFDYGELDEADPTAVPERAWAYRPDAFSSYRAGFEVRTCRRCERVLMLHHIPDQPASEEFPAQPGYEGVVRGTRFLYDDGDDPSLPTGPIYSFLRQVVQSGWQQENGRTSRRDLPPLEFRYSQPRLGERLETVDPASLENLPIGLDGSAYRWLDLHGEGLPGLLSEQAGEWVYKRNLSPISQRLRPDGREAVATFAPLETVARRPAMGLAAGAQVLDLEGDGRPDLVAFSGPLPGFHAHDGGEGWEPFEPFRQLPNLDFNDPNLRFIDLDGDGHADLLLSAGEALVWHRSLAKEGFGEGERVPLPWDEEQGPRVLFADGGECLHLADMSGDGLADVVRIRAGQRGQEICYWPNLGHGRFGAKVAMDNPPLFDHPELFDPRRLLLADIDGSGTTDLIYLHGEGVRLAFNQSGNSWSAVASLAPFAPIHTSAQVTCVDLLGNGTACLVWSSPLPGDSGRQLRYLPLMAEGKPHLLIHSRNNLGAETTIRYAPSTRFALEDALAGRPWITKLPFPVHVVESVSVSDRWRGSRFTSTYSYHHGYFDGHEREFRGFGRVEQTDVEEFGTFAAGNAASPYITEDLTLYQPPVKTITWFHTGAFLDRRRILSQFAAEFGAPRSETFAERALPEPELEALDLSADEWREALRACKGMVLRQEVVELEVEALARGEEVRVKLLTTATHNSQIQRLQPRGANRHAVFLVTESEALTYHYELDLRQPTPPDPRIAHSLNLQIDGYGRVLESVVVAYPRLVPFREDTPAPGMGATGGAALPPGTAALIREVQAEAHLAYTSHRYTADVQEADGLRLGLPCEISTYELTGLAPSPGDLFRLEELRAAAIATAVPAIAYHVWPQRTTPEKRLVEQVRMLFFSADLATPLPLGQLTARALPFETYKLALTAPLLEAVLGERLTPEIRSELGREALSGYLSGRALRERFEEPGWREQYWIRSGQAGFGPGAAERFFLPERYTDAFGQVSTLAYDDPLWLLPRRSVDPLGNETAVLRVNYRVLAPEELRDANGNRSEVAFDGLGLPVALALKGKGDEADGLEDVPLEVAPEQLRQFFSGAYDEAEARRLLGGATARHLYSFGEELDAAGQLVWGVHPACAAGLLREVHRASGGGESPLQAAFAYADGSGSVLVSKSQAEPERQGEPLRWIASGKTVLNNKGKPVLQYEPYFSPSGHRFEEPLAVGVTAILYYDAVGRQVRTELPDGTVQRVAFTPWWQESWDGSDTVMEPGNRWLARRTDPADPEFPRFDTPEHRQAARQAAVHANTPAVTHLDSLGREVVAISHNRWQRDGELLEEKAVTYSKLDAEGKPLWIEDARGNRVMDYTTPPGAERAFTPCYDIAGNLLFQHSMDGGDRWLVADATGQPFYAWDRNERVGDDGVLALEERLLHTTYDPLRRPLEQRLRLNGGEALVVERLIYGEGHPEAQARNLRGQLWQHFGPSGLDTNERFDFKGNRLEASRRLSARVEASVLDWNREALAEERFVQRTEVDAMNRMTRLENWHRAERPDRPAALYRPSYNERGALQAETLTVRGETQQAIVAITYDAKGQKLSISYGNRTRTEYSYDPETFRLTRLLTRRGGGGEVFQDLRYSYDAVGNITHIQDEAQQTIYFRNQRLEPNASYSYDALHRLIEATGREHLGLGSDGQPQPPRAPDQFNGFPADQPHPHDGRAMGRYRERYHYDAVGNILEMAHQGSDPAHPGWTRHYAYAPDSNRLLRTWYGSRESEAVRYGYDTHGSLLNLANTPEEYGLNWDGRDMIHRVNLGGGGQVFYSYDSEKQRRRKHIQHQGNRVEERLYLDGMELYRRWVGGELREEIESHHLFAVDQRLLLVDDVLVTDDPTLPVATLMRYQYGNHLGSVSLELTGGGDPQVLSYEEYHPYGTTAYRSTNAAIRAKAKRYRYTGMERDEETGLSYHTARYYLPWLGRWGSVDPIGVADELNVYNNSSDNPIILSDPSGTQAISRWDEQPGEYEVPSIGRVQVQAVVNFEDDIVYGDAGVARARHEIDSAYREYTAFHQALSRTVVEGTADLLTLGMYSQTQELQRIYDLILEGEYSRAIQSIDRLYQITPQARINALTNLGTELYRLHSDMESDDPEIRGTARGTAAGFAINIINGLAFGAATSGPGSSLSASSDGLANGGPETPSTHAGTGSTATTTRRPPAIVDTGVLFRASHAHSPDPEALSAIRRSEAYITRSTYSEYVVTPSVSLGVERIRFLRREGIAILDPRLGQITPGNSELFWRIANHARRQSMRPTADGALVLHAMSTGYSILTLDSNLQSFLRSTVPRRLRPSVTIDVLAAGNGNPR